MGKFTRKFPAQLKEIAEEDRLGARVASANGPDASIEATRQTK
jgi:hypothetical protein